MNKICTLLLCSAIIGLISCSDEDRSTAPYTINFRANLNGPEMNPPNSSSATGSFNASFNSVTNKLGYRLTVNGMTPFEAHLHKAASPNVGPVVHTLTEISPLIYGDTLIVTESLADSMALGYFYIDVSSAAFPGGEIRGQIEKY
ncbi:MAG TPA: CHRD domain-containing protein [Ferruginibacter sp.]|nr:CHRD domain-containing protein [Ferruginibacter sp.]HRO97126.1 CHRD domain-containing protein [Ferruginibacter sp.]